MYRGVTAAAQGNSLPQANPRYRWTCLRYRAPLLLLTRFDCGCGGYLRHPGRIAARAHWTRTGGHCGGAPGRSRARPVFRSFFRSDLLGADETSFTDALVTPDGVLTGRLATWNTLAAFLTAHPWHIILGIGFKTLPYSKFVGTELVADNTYLSLLVETGVIGLAAFLFLNWRILRGGLTAARSQNPRAAFLGQWIFCFWAGEMVQMLSGDLVTYWRVLPVYFCVLGMAMREAGTQK